MASGPSRSSLREITVLKREYELLETRLSQCDDFQAHLQAQKRLSKVEDRIESIKTRVKSRSESLARQFDRVLAILSGRGFLQGWTLSDSGLRLARLYHESDLLVSLALEQGLFDNLSVPELAGLVSVFTYESRGPFRTAPTFPTSSLAKLYTKATAIWEDLVAEEGAMSIPLTREVDAGFIEPAYRWAQGRELSQVLLQSQLSAGDFVRNVKQLIDLCRQLALLSPNPKTVQTARGVVDVLLRGVVSASSVVGIDVAFDYGSGEASDGSEGFEVSLSPIVNS